MALQMDNKPGTQTRPPVQTFHYGANPLLNKLMVKYCRLIIAPHIKPSPPLAPIHCVLVPYGHRITIKKVQ